MDPLPPTIALPPLPLLIHRFTPITPTPTSFYPSLSPYSCIVLPPITPHSYIKLPPLPPKTV